MNSSASHGSSGSFGRHVPNLAVLIGLAALAFVGHRTGWKVPRLAELRGGAAHAREDWCEAHGVPDTRCISCHPELGGNEAKDWCREHGVPESKCTTCHPEILTKGQAADWCKEHGVPESGCALCHPEIAVRGPAPASDSKVKAVLEPGARPNKDPSACQTHQVRVQFASADSVKKAGVKVAALEERRMTATVSANAEVGYDLTRVARLAPRVAGSVWRVEKDAGAHVAKGEVLALIDAADVGHAKAELLQALAAVDLRTKTYARVETSAASGIRTQAELQEAEAALREARVRLFNAQQALANLGLPVSAEKVQGVTAERLSDAVRLLGLPDPIAKALEGETTTANLLPVVSPLEGDVVAREVVAGEVVETTRTLFVVADLAHLWVNIDVPLEASRSIARGQRILFRADVGLDEAVRGEVVWVSPAVDDKTRTVRVRAAVENPERKLRAHTFGTARIALRDEARAVAVPDEAIHWEGCCHVVFVRLTDDIFQTRKVRLGARAGGYTEALAGVSTGEVIATTGSHVLKSELLKSKLGAGCCD